MNDFKVGDVCSVIVTKHLDVSYFVSELTFKRSNLEYNFYKIKIVKNNPNSKNVKIEYLEEVEFAKPTKYLERIYIIKDLKKLKEEKLKNNLLKL